MNIELDKAIAKFQNECKTFATGYMQENNQLPMVVIFLAQNDKNEFINVIAPDIGPMHAEDKPRFIAAVKTAITTIKPVAVALITEAWIVKRPLGSDINLNIRPSEQPDREEVVMVQIETYKSAGMHLYDIIHHTNGEISLEYDKETSSDSIDKSDTKGTFSNLLKENYDKFYRDIVESINKNQN